MILKKNNYIYLFLFIILIICGCDNKLERTDDFAEAKIEIQNSNWTEAERLISRYLKEESNKELRWEAWNELINIINRAGSEPVITLEYLAAMLYEFEADETKYKTILYKMGILNEDIWLYDRASDVWLRYIYLDNLNGEEAVNVHRRLAKIYYLSKHFESAEDILNNCLALDAPPDKVAYCMYDLVEHNVAQQRWEEATDLSMQLLDMEIDHKVKYLTLFLLADSLEQQERFIQSLSYFVQSQEIYPNVAAVNKRIEFLKIKVNNKSKSTDKTKTIDKTQ